MHEYVASVEPNALPGPAGPPGPPGPPPAADADAQLPWYALRKNKKALAAKCKHFYLTFVRTHGMLYTWTRRAAAAARAEGPNAAAAAAAIEPLDTALFAALSGEVLDEFDLLLSASAITEVVAVRLLVVCLFSVHHSAALLDSTTLGDHASPNGAGRGRGNAPPPERPSRTHPESLALSLLFRLVTKAARRLEAVSRQPDKANRAAVAVRILPLLSVFTEWAWECKKYLVLQKERDITTNGGNGGNGGNSGNSGSLPLLRPAQGPIVLPTAFSSAGAMVFLDQGNGQGQGPQGEAKMSAFKEMELRYAGNHHKGASSSSPSLSGAADATGRPRSAPMKGRQLSKANNA